MNMDEETADVSEFVTEKPGIRTEPAERQTMSSVAEASMLLRHVAGLPERPIKPAITRAARRVSKYLLQPMKISRAEDIWRQEARQIRAEEMDAIRKAAAADREVKEAKHVLADIDARIARLEALLIQDEDFHRDQVAQIRAAYRAPDRPVD